MPAEIESDAAMVVGWINNSRKIDSEVGLVIEEIRLMVQGMIGCTVNYASRKANFVAHNIAKLALSNNKDKCGWRSILIVLDKVYWSNFLAMCKSFFNKMFC
ncbi:hypothetical protein LWI29_023530 [Acer saccharum]|uniref:RNase H type-1 domain-containing protein n=1 Tax=Acer saccharum TaxID=4024 RepID=A0AA39TM55_ACESA|nr:hypothetical protein LWI29_023530 [Acer saccharum]